ncbi:hypothetical protein [Streptomyces sp. NPDC001348]
MSSTAQPQPDGEPPPPNVYHPSAAPAPAYEGYADPAAAHGWQNAYDETRELPVAVGGDPPGAGRAVRHRAAGRGARRRSGGRRGRRAAVAVGAVGVASLAAVIAGLAVSGSPDAPQGRHGRTASTAGGDASVPGRSVSPSGSSGDPTAGTLKAVEPAAAGAGGTASEGGLPDGAARSASPAVTSAASAGVTPTAPATATPTASRTTAESGPGNSRGHGRGNTKGPK